MNPVGLGQQFGGQEVHSLQGDQLMSPLWQVSDADGPQPLSVRAWWVWPNKARLLYYPPCSATVGPYRQTPHWWSIKIEALIWVSFWRALKFQLFSWRAGSNPRRQSKNILEMKNTKFILNSCMNYMVHVFSTMWRIKTQPSNSIACSDIALRLLVHVAGILDRGMPVTSSFSIRGCILKGCFERGIFWSVRVVFEGHWRLHAIHSPHYLPLGLVANVRGGSLGVNSRDRRVSKSNWWVGYMLWCFGCS